MSEKLHTSKIFYSGFLLVLLVALLYLFKSYLMAIVIGILLAISTLSIQNFSLRVCNNRNILATSLTMFILLGVFCLPFFYLVIAVVKYISNLDINTITSIFNQIKSYELNLPKNLEFIKIILILMEFLKPKIELFIASLDIENIIKKSLEFTSKSLSKGVDFAVDMSFIMIFIFFVHYYSRALGKYVASIAPIATKELKEIFSEVANTMSVVFYSTIANMVLQGVLFAFIASFYGYNGVLFGVLFGFASLIPIVGGALVFVPLALYELSVNGWVNALVIVVYTVIVVSTVADNFIKPGIIKFISSKLLGSQAKINELIIFFAMIAGLSSFGFWGIILGPAIVTLFIASIRVYAK